jgi:hypothetical protein
MNRITTANAAFLTVAFALLAFGVLSFIIPGEAHAGYWTTYCNGYGCSPYYVVTCNPYGCG